MQLFCLKHVDVDYRDKLRKKIASFWSSLRKYEYIAMHGPQNVKKEALALTVETSWIRR